MDAEAAKAGIDSSAWLRSLIDGTAPLRSSEAARARARQNQLLVLVAQQLCGLRQDLHIHETPTVETLVTFDALALQLFAAIRAEIAPYPFFAAMPPCTETKKQE
jgi:hypothetical protein